MLRGACAKSKELLLLWRVVLVRVESFPLLLLNQFIVAIPNTSYYLSLAEDCFARHVLVRFALFLNEILERLSRKFSL